MNFIARCLIAVTLLGITSSASAQAVLQVTPAPTARRVTATLQMNMATAAAQAAATASAGGSSASGENPELQSQRMQKINELIFDRRPSSILKAWNEPPPEEEPVDESATDSTDANAAEDEPSETEAESDVDDADTPDDASTDTANGASTDGDAESDATSESADADEADSSEEPADEDPAGEAAAAETDPAEEAAEKQRQTQEALAAFDRQLERLKRNVTLGVWPEVQEFLATLSEEEGRAAYDRLLQSLLNDPQNTPADPNMLQQLVLQGADAASLQQALSIAGQGAGAAFAEQHLIAMTDVAGLFDACPHEKDDATFTKLGSILLRSISAGHDLNRLLAMFQDRTGDEERAVEPRQIARLLAAAGQTERSGEFLPTLHEARANGDAQGLNLLAELYLALHQNDRKPAYLEDAWTATQAVLEIPTPELPEVTAAAESASAPDEAAESESKPPDGDSEDGDSAQVDRDRAAESETVAESADDEVEPGDGDADADEPDPVEEAKQAIERLEKEKAAALRRAVQLAVRVRDELGQAWLDQSFTGQPERGREILAAIGDVVSNNLLSHPFDPDFRLKSLQLQKSAVEALLRAAPEQAAEWQHITTVLAAGWLKEAQASYHISQNSYQRPGWQRDQYGNYYYAGDQVDNPLAQYQSGQARAVDITDILEVRPTPEWLELVAIDLRPRFETMCAQLHLKAGEEAEAFPYIEQLATTHPEQAHDLAEEFVRVWTTNHNPNESRDRNPYMYYWGYVQRADRIPLTRSKQERNLEELAEWIARLRALPIEPVNERLLTRAFTTAHSRAEVYRLEVLEEVFGSLENLEPVTLSELVQQMRGNLATVWQMPDVQEQNNTNRKQRDMQAEVLRGYELARSVLENGLEQYPDHWALVLAQAAVMHDENDYYRQLEESPEFAPRREAALARFQEAAALYVQAVPDLPEDEQSTQVFQQWFYASLGAVDLGRVTADHVPDLRQPELIRQSIMSLPAETAEEHLSKFANRLFTGANDAKPELKFRYLRTGFEIVGDHPMAREARKLLDYYADLVTEIKLDVQIDGSSDVGHDEPFGIFVNLVHTKEIERESGGFGKYLQNQNTPGYYYYNFGRPLEDYRDKFQATADQALGEHFEVISVTFQDPKVNSRALPEYGWRMTPYAYIVLRAKGPEIDKIAPLRIDLDFLDTSGYVVLPVESPTLPIDAATESAAPRPAESITVVQTLDERQADEGKLLLEIRATARGLVPPLDELLDVSPEGFEIAELEDGGALVSEFDDAAAGNAVSSERLWTISLQSTVPENRLPETFQFAAAKLPVDEILYQRYDDADLVPVEAEIALRERYGATSYAWLRWLPVGLVLLLVAGFGLRLLTRRRPEQEDSRYQLPEPLTPFTVLALLDNIQRTNGLDAAQQSELTACIHQLEQHYFADHTTAQPDLQNIATRWVTLAR